MATADNVIISVQNLCKYFKKDAIRALDGISVDIRQGDVIAAIGPSGSGKSTFLRSLNLLETPTSDLSCSTASISRRKRSTSTSCARRWAWSSSISTSSRTGPSCRI